MRISHEGRFHNSLAYPYDLPAGFYDTSAGPLTTNLGVVPNVNFNASGYNYNVASIARVPYAQGSAELNWRGRNGAFGLIDVTYYGTTTVTISRPSGAAMACSARSRPLDRRHAAAFLLERPHVLEQLEAEDLLNFL